LNDVYDASPDEIWKLSMLPPRNIIDVSSSHSSENAPTAAFSEEVLEGRIEPWDLCLPIVPQWDP
tara:strand:+ start:642 stop:836 length:195 start_codon:yes stop_codon:yes gene_type:complete